MWQNVRVPLATGSCAVEDTKSLTDKSRVLTLPGICPLCPEKATLLMD
jgi:hypothetical protein